MIKEKEKKIKVIKTLVLYFLSLLKTFRFKPKIKIKLISKIYLQNNIK